MLPLIPAIILLLLQGPSSYERFPQDARLPGNWSALQGSAVVDPSQEAVLACLLAIAGAQATVAVDQTVDAPGMSSTSDGFRTDFGSAPRLLEALQDCRRTRDGPDSIA